LFLFTDNYYLYYYMYDAGTNIFYDIKNTTLMTYYEAIDACAVEEASLIIVDTQEKLGHISNILSPLPPCKF